MNKSRAPPPEVVQRRQSLNESAYYAALKALIMTGQNDAKAMMLMAKLRMELGINAESHKQWVQELTDHMNNGQHPPHHHTALTQHHLPLTSNGSDAGVGPTATAPAAAAAAPAPKAKGASAVQQAQAAAGTTAGAAGSRSATATALAAAGQTKGEKAKAIKAAAKKKNTGDMPELIGCKVRRFWPAEGDWFEGVVTDFRATDNLYCITYDLGKGQNESYEWFDCQNADSSNFKLTNDKVDLKQYSHTRAYQSSRVLNPKGSAPPATGKITKKGGKLTGKKRSININESDDD